MMDWLMGARAGAATWLSLELVRATVLLLAAVVAALTLRRASAAARHLVWSAGLVSLLVVPAVSALLPWRWSPITTPAPVTAVSSTSRSAEVMEDAGAAPLARVPERSSSITVPQPAPLERALSFVADNWLALVAGVWAAGVLLFVVRLAFGGLLLRAIVRRARPVEESAWLNPLFDAADRLDLPEAPRLVFSERMPMPYVTGLVHPTIVLPAAAANWSPERRRAVLLHELAHVRRRDLVVNSIAHVACALWWFHPLARVAARRLRSESERACDDLVLRLGTLPSAYADHLLQIVRDAGRVAAPAVALPMAQRREFEGRMLAILEADARRDPPRRRHAALAVLACALLGLPLAALGPVPAAADAPPASVATPPDAGAAETPPVPPGDETEAPDPSQRDVDTGAATQDPADSHEDDDVAPRVQVVQDTGVIAALRAALRDPSGEVRAEAAWALASMHATSAAPDLVPLLDGDVSPKARRMAVWSIAQLDYGDGVPALERAARSDDDAEVREMAVWALGQFARASSLPAVLDALADEDAEVRGIAAWAAGTLRPEDAPAPLIAALQDEDGEVREHAAWALGQIGDPDALSALTRVIGDDSAGEIAMWAIGNIGGEAARPALMEALRNGNDEVRAAAARALAGRGSHPWPWPWPRPITR